MSLPLLGSGGAGAIVPTPGANAAAFLARTSGLDLTHRNAYTDLINGLDTDSLFTKFDFLHIYATQDATTALLNLVSSSYDGTKNGVTISFAADRGFTGVHASTTNYIATGFNPTSAPSPKYTLNSAHLSAWNLSNITSTDSPIGGYNTGPAAHCYILTHFTDGKDYFRINTNIAGANDGNTLATTTGFYNGVRADSANTFGYINGAQVNNNTSTAAALLNQNIVTCGVNAAGTPTGSEQQVACVSAGSKLTGAEATLFYNRLRTYMTVVGVP